MSITISHSVFVKGKKYLWCLERFSPFALPFHECYSSYHGHSNKAIRWINITEKKPHYEKFIANVFLHYFTHRVHVFTLQTYDHLIIACWVWGWLHVKRVIETTLLLLYTPLKNPPSKILTKAISIWGTSRYLLSGREGVHMVFRGGGGENQLSPTEYKGDTTKILPPRRPVPIKNFLQRRHLYFCVNATFDNT